jgi:hypothetical protein
MKTRRNHRHKTATSMRRRRNTRIYRRKGTTVSSGRRRHFFKRGGEPYAVYRNSAQGYSKSIYVAPLTQLERDREEAADKAARVAKQNAKNAAAEINYRAVVEFVENIGPINTKGIISRNISENVEKLTVKELDRKDFYIGDVKKDQTPVTIKINDVTVKFYINSDGNTVVIYVDDILYGYVMIKINGTNYESGNRGIYSPDVSIAIIDDLNASSST